MTPKVPDELQASLHPLFEALPVDRAMRRLVVTEPADAEQVELVERVLREPALQDKPELAAGLWLYVDALDRSHHLSQGIESPTGAFWHAIMHRREGDFSNSHYWYRKTGTHPAMHRIDIAGGSAGAGTTVGGYDPHKFVDKVERAQRDGAHGHHDLVALQRREWLALFEWCAER